MLKMKENNSRKSVLVFKSLFQAARIDSDDEDEDIIPATPVDKNGSKKGRVKKMRKKTYVDEDGFLVTTSPIILHVAKLICLANKLILQRFYFCNVCIKYGYFESDLR